MKKLLTVLFCIVALAALPQTTNFFWSANKTSNEIHQAISTRLGTNNTFTLTISTGAPPVITLFYGLTTNIGVNVPGPDTNYLWFTNGVLTKITNSPT